MAHGCKRVAGLLVVASVLGCSSNQPTVPIAEPIGDAGDAGAVLPSLDGAIGTTLTDACREFARAGCAFDQRCTPGLFLTSSGTIARCEERAAADCIRTTSLPGMKKTADLVLACAREYQTVPCDKPPFFFSEACAATAGDLADGARCEVASQCKGRACIGTQTATCGVCGPLRNVGEPCQDSSQCAGAAACRSGVCAISANGAPCDETNVCSAPMVCVANKCYARLLVEGETCSVTADYCDDEKGFVCNAQTQKCSPITFVTQGTCGESGSGGIVACTYPALCIMTSQTLGNCASPLADGAACSVSSGPYCVSECVPAVPGSDNGKCGPPPPTVCN